MVTVQVKSRWERFYKEQDRLQDKILDSFPALHSIVDFDGVKNVTLGSEDDLKYIIIDCGPTVVIAALGGSGMVKKGSANLLSNVEFIIIEVKNKDMVHFSEMASFARHFVSASSWEGEQYEQSRFPELRKKLRYALTNLKYPDLTFKLDKAIKKLDDFTFVDNLRRKNWDSKKD